MRSNYLYASSLALTLSSLAVTLMSCGDPNAGAGNSVTAKGAGGANSGMGSSGTSTTPIDTGDGNSAIFDDPDAEQGDANQGPPPSAGCGDGILTEDEACDDANNLDGDGCAFNCLKLESGFSCAVPGQACLPIAVCGDGVVADSEQCDDANRLSGDGCSERCKYEIGMKCSGQPSVCEPATCGDGIIEGAESCDDMNTMPFDGCSDRCVAEPKCDPAAASCTSECGDGLVINEDCDDGNRIDGDGCSAACTIEPGFMCMQVQPECERINGECVFRVPTIFRDHSGSHPDFGAVTGECQRTVPDSNPPELVSGNRLTTGLVSPTLGATGRPQLVGGMGTQLCESDSDKQSYVGITQFDTWFDSAAPNVVTVPGEIILFDNGNGGFVNRFTDEGEQFQGYDGEEWAEGGAFTCSWCLDGSCPDRCDGEEIMFDGSPLFFPVDDVMGPTSDMGPAKVPEEYGYTAWPWEEDVFPGAPNHNFYFTSEVQTWFEYTSTMNARLEFTGDDDVWVFVNGVLAVDLGGIHAPEVGEVVISSATAAQFGLVENGVYKITVFQAERRMDASSFRLTLSGFERVPSDCTALCGDAVVSFGEECDDGLNDGGYGECAAGCRLGEFCGDGVVNGPEDCDPGPGGNGDGCSGCRRLKIAK